VGEPTELPDWVRAEVAEWPLDAWGVHHARLLLRDGTVLEPVAVLPSGELAGWGGAGAVEFEADDVVAIERLDR
jgi:hypothetical protein